MGIMGQMYRRCKEQYKLQVHDLELTQPAESRNTCCLQRKLPTGSQSFTFNMKMFTLCLAPSKPKTVDRGKFQYCVIFGTNYIFTWKDPCIPTQN